MLVGKTFDEAKKILSENNIAYEVFEEYSNIAEKDTVIFQSVEKGTQMTEGTLMYLTVSLGKENADRNKPVDTPKRLRQNMLLCHLQHRLFWLDRA